VTRWLSAHETAMEGGWGKQKAYHAVIGGLGAGRWKKGGAAIYRAWQSKRKTARTIDKKLFSTVLKKVGRGPKQRTS